MATIISGKELSQELKDAMKLEVEELCEKHGRVPHLAVVLVGNNPSSISYVTGKEKACEYVGIKNSTIRVSEDITEEELIQIINELNNDCDVDGILVQLPLPKHISEEKIIETIAIEKDVDGVNSHSFGLMTMGVDAYASATPLGIIRLLYEYNISLTGKHAVVVGRSQILGKPLAMLLLNENCTVTICHSKTEGLHNILKSADIVVGALGRPKFIQKER